MCSQYACTDTPSGWSRSSFLRGGVGFPNMVAVFLQLCCVRIDRASARLQFATVRLALIVEPSLLDFKAWPVLVVIGSKPIRQWMDKNCPKTDKLLRNHTDRWKWE